MAIRRSDTRRRRVGVLSDEHAAVPVELPKSSTPITESDSETDKTVNEYSISARRRHLAKTTDLIPKRGWSVAFLVLGVIAGISLVNVLFFYANEMTGLLGERALEVFSLTKPGSLAQWSCTLSLLIAGLASFQVYALRRHRSDDYVGTYKLWLLIASGLLLASLSSAIGLHGLLLHAAGVLIGSDLGPGSSAFAALVVLAILLLAARILVEVRQSRTAIVGVVVVTLLFAAAAVMQVTPVKTQLASSYEATYGNLILMGNVCLLLTVFFYARFVYLRAQGILATQYAAVVSSTEEVSSEKKSTKSKKASKSTPKASKATVKSKAATKPKANSKSNSRQDAAEVEPVNAPTLNLETRPANTQESDESAAADQSNSTKKSSHSSPLGEKLSKAKAKKLRKQKKQQQRRAA